MQNRIRGEDIKTTSIHFKAYNNGNWEGELHNVYLKLGCAFKSLTQFLVSMENLMDSMNAPQTYVETRYFNEKARKEPEYFPQMVEGENIIASFVVKINFRQHSSWQGVLIWMDGKRRANFRSVLELVKLIDSAMLEKEDIA